ncbi:MAG: hypothetical protein ACI9MC_000049 [Kiritimatiellia bacterium]|jgi:hypothetical protein
MLLIMLSTLGWTATPTAGLEWAPLSRADLSWVAEGRTTGRAVGELDGTAHPALRAWAGAWLSERFGLTGGLGVARLQSTVWVDDTWRSRHWGVLRPSIDARFSLLRRDSDLPRPLLLLGLHGDIPSARDVSNGFTEAELEQADVDAEIERARLGGFGGRVGAGADIAVHPNVALGFQWTATWHRSVLRTSEASTVSSWVAGEAALTIAFEW